MDAKRPRFRVLYLTNKTLDAPLCGGSVREYNLLKHLVDQHEIHLLAFVGSIPSDVKSESKGLSLSKVSIVTTEPTSIQGSDVPSRLIEHAHPHGKSIVRDLVDKISPDLIHVEGYFLMQHIPAQLNVPVLIVGENIESDLSYAAASTQGMTERKRATVNREIDEEVRCWRQATLVVMVTDVDAARVRSIAFDIPVICVGNGIDLPNQDFEVLDSANGARPLSALFVGNYGWFPTSDAALHLVRDIWPRVRMLLPEARLVLAGKNAPDSLVKAASIGDGTTLLGAFDHYSDLLSEADIFICPLRFGGGFKVKIAEAMSYGLPVVCSSVSTEGFPSIMRDAVITVNRPETFALVSAALLEATTTRAKMSQLSVNAVSKLPSWKTQALELERSWAECVRKKAEEPT